MNEFAWKDKDKLKEQLKFFGAKKQQFISVYAKKPRIRVEVKKDEYKLIDDSERWRLQQNVALGRLQQNVALANLRSSQASALYNAASISGLSGKNHNLLGSQAHWLQKNSVGYPVAAISAFLGSAGIHPF